MKMTLIFCYFFLLLDLLKSVYKYMKIKKNKKTLLFPNDKTKTYKLN